MQCKQPTNRQRGMKSSTSMKKTIMVINPVTVKDRHEHTAPHAPIWPKMKMIELENKQYNSRECKTSTPNPYRNWYELTQNPISNVFKLNYVLIRMQNVASPSKTTITSNSTSTFFFFLKHGNTTIWTETWTSELVYWPELPFRTMTYVDAGLYQKRKRVGLHFTLGRSLV